MTKKNRKKGAFLPTVLLFFVDDPLCISLSTKRVSEMTIASAFTLVVNFSDSLSFALSLVVEYDAGISQSQSYLMSQNVLLSLAATIK